MNSAHVTTPQVPRWHQALWFGLVWLLLFGVQQGELDAPVREGMAQVLQPAMLWAQQGRQLNQRFRAVRTLWQMGSQRLLESEQALAQCQLSVDEQQLLEKENALLRAALGQSERPSQGTVFQFYGSGDVWFVNGGEKEGVTNGDIVMWDGSLVGVISEALPHHSQVRTLLDQSWQIPVQVGTASARALLSQSRGYPEVVLLPQNVPLQNEDSVSTSGDADLPPNVPIGRIESLSDTPDGATRQATVRFYQMPRNLSLVEVKKQGEL